MTVSWQVGRVVAVHRETSTGRAIDIDVPDWAGNLAGQHLDLRLTAPDGYSATRSYSLASSGAGTRIQLAVDKLPDGEVSPYLVDDVAVGDELEVRGPLGGWFVWRTEDAGPVQLIAGGSGVVPVMAMLRARRRSESTAEFRLLYSVRAPDDVIFADEIAAIARDGFAVDWVYTRQTPPDWPVAAGRVTPATLAELTIAVAEHPAVFVCGPTGFVEAVADALVRLGHPSERVKTERFGGS